jgi:DNA-binding HxlR family transcriptional regulator
MRAAASSPEKETRTRPRVKGSQRRVYHCPVEVTLELIGGRWKPLILWHLEERGVLRHGALRRLMPTIAQRC